MDFFKWVGTQSTQLTPEPPDTIDFNVLETCGSGPAALYYCVVAENEETEQLVGYALSTYNYMIWLGKSLFLENIFVLDAHRRKGIGNRLLAAICQHGLEKGCVSVTYVSAKDQDSRAFFAKHNFLDTTEKEGWFYYALSKNGLTSAAEI